MVSPKSSLTIAVGGGKGGVGKSVVTSNLAIAFGRLGFRTLVVDADLGAANLHTMFGIDRPGATLQAFVDGRIESLEEAVVPTVVPKVFLVPGSGARLGAADLGYDRKLRLIRSMLALDADVILVDCGAGTGAGVVDLFTASDVRLVVVTPQLTSLQNAYGFLKQAVYGSLSEVCLSAGESDVLQGSTFGTETERIRDVLRRVALDNPGFAGDLRGCLDAFEAGIIGNQIEHVGQRRPLEALSRMFKDFLDLRVPVHTTLPRTSRIHRSVTRRRPLLVDDTTGPIVRSFMQLAEQLAETNVADVRSRRRRPESADDAELPGPVANHLRLHERVPVRVECTVVRGSSSHRATMVDVSFSGAGLRTSVSLAPGEEIRVDIPELGNLGAVVARSKGENVGVHFEDEAAARFVVEQLHERSRAA